MKRLFIPLLIAGIFPFVYPFIGFIYRMIISESWTLGDWLILYSFVYWPTYVVGLLLVSIAIIIRVKYKKKIKEK